MTALDRFSETVLAKAGAVLARGAIAYYAESDLFTVEGSGGSRYYVSLLPDEAGEICTCRNGVKKGGHPTCYHVAAALMYAEKRTDGDLPAS